MKKIRNIVPVIWFILFFSIAEAQTFYTKNGYAEFQAEATLNNYKGYPISWKVK